MLEKQEPHVPGSEEETPGPLGGHRLERASWNRESGQVLGLCGVGRSGKKSPDSVCILEVALMGIVDKMDVSVGKKRTQ